MVSMLLDGSPLEDPHPIDSADRCDRCGAQAYVRVTRPSGEIYLCGHHYAENKTAVLDGAWAVRDERENLLAK